MKHAYYIARFDGTFGDAPAEDLRGLFFAFCASFFHPKKGYQGSLYDGVSHYDTKDGPKTVLILKNFFDPNPQAFSYIDPKTALSKWPS